MSNPPLSRDEQINFMSTAKQRRAEAVERWANNRELQRSLRMTADEHKAQEHVSIKEIRKDGTLGPELISNGDFSSGTDGWSTAAQKEDLTDV
jgi:hypothetical protein